MSANSNRPAPGSTFGSAAGYNAGSRTWCSLQWIRDGRKYGSGSDGGVAVPFLEAGDDLIAHRLCDVDARHADMMFVPIAYLYRHAVELLLKEMVSEAWRADLLTKSETDEAWLRREHRLEPLWKRARPAAEKRWPDEPKDELDRVEAVVLDLHLLDPTGQELRYVRDTKGKPTGSAIPDVVDLEHFRDAVHAACSLIGCCAGEFERIGDHNMEDERNG